MSDDQDHFDDDWADVVAKWTFVFTVVLAVLYVGSVVIFVLR